MPDRQLEDEIEASLLSVLYLRCGRQLSWKTSTDKTLADLHHFIYAGKQLEAVIEPPCIRCCAFGTGGKCVAKTWIGKTVADQPRIIFTRKHLAVMFSFTP